LAELSRRNEDLDVPEHGWKIASQIRREAELVPHSPDSCGWSANERRELRLGFARVASRTFGSTHYRAEKLY
jgi:hypothetical protein